MVSEAGVAAFTSLPMVRRTLALGALAVLAVTLSSTVARARPASRPPATQSFVVVNAAGSLYSRPGSIAVDYEARKTRINDPGLGRVFRLIRDDGAWLLVENLSAAELAFHCVSESESHLEDARLRFWVKRKDLMQVSVQGAMLRDNGTQISISKGIPVVITPAGGSRFDVQGFSFTMPPASLSQGWMYQNLEKLPEPKPRLPMREVKASVFAANQVRIGSLVDVDGELEDDFKFIHSDRAHPIYTISPRGEDVAAEMWTGCVWTHALIPYGGIGLPATPSRRPPEKKPKMKKSLRQGTRLYWRGGEIAGRAGSPMEYFDEAPPDGKRTCLRVVAMETTEQPKKPLEFLEICVKKKALR